MADGHCCLCHAALAGKRSDARFCSDTCRADAHRISRLLAGERVTGYRSVAEWLAAIRTADEDADLLVRLGRDQTTVQLRAEARAARRAARVPRQPIDRGPWVRVLLLDPCAYCGRTSSQIDHLVAVSGGGSGDWTNLTGACGSCNASKNATKLVLHLARVGLH